MKANNNLHIYIKVPELVFNISWSLNQTTIIADWEVSTGIMILNGSDDSGFDISTPATITNPSSCALLHCYSQCQ